MKIKQFITSKRFKYLGLSLGAIVIIAALLFGSFSFEITPKNSNVKAKITIGSHQVEASGITQPDYYTTGSQDYLVFQQALNNLPAIGGELQVLAGTYNWGAGVHTVSRAINNVIITGVGLGTSFVGDGVNPIFSVGAQTGWKFSDLKTDAGGITNIANAYAENVTVGATYYGVKAVGSIQGTAITGTSVTDSGLTADGLVVSGVGGLLDTSHANAATLKVSGDTDDYFTFSTVSDVPTITATGSDYWTSYNSINYNQLESPTTAPTLAIGAAGAMNGLYRYSVTFVTATGETEDGTVTSSPGISPVNQKVELSDIPISTDSRVTSRNIWRTKDLNNPVNDTRMQYLLVNIPDNSTTTYSDKIYRLLLLIVIIT